MDNYPVYPPVTSVTNPMTFRRGLEKENLRLLLKMLRYIFLYPDNKKSAYNFLYCRHLLHCRKNIIQDCPIQNCTHLRYVIGHIANCVNVECTACWLFREAADIRVLEIFRRNILVYCEIKWRLHRQGVSLS